jgi:hypothetical protein
MKVSVQKIGSNWTFAETKPWVYSLRIHSIIQPQLYRLPFHQQGTPTPDGTGAIVVIRHRTAKGNTSFFTQDFPSHLKGKKCLWRLQEIVMTVVER